ncbi:DUF3606 domain-containing protein [Mesorhizobium sp. LNHC229A00]|uniref:DUF3606 domain-containing protein n=1 Tax=Mesorhizobium sp. LNHC229A00 TaxID=1287240 RepID=UPI0003CED109|nr:DUF3606 domain-containing protein [Mesorhizobium sp. LNHC229A00]ESY89667.1 hypothetical protein X741_29125 [Mesorhizobium sp. LNHC229A00]
MSDDSVEDFARQTGVTAEQVRELIKATGRDRAALVAAAAQLRALSNGGRLPRTRSEVDDEDGGIWGWRNVLASAPEWFPTDKAASVRSNL